MASVDLPIISGQVALGEFGRLKRFKLVARPQIHALTNNLASIILTFGLPKAMEP